MRPHSHVSCWMFKVLTPCAKLTCSLLMPAVHKAKDLGIFVRSRDSHILLWRSAWAETAFAAFWVATFLLSFSAWPGQDKRLQRYAFTCSHMTQPASHCSQPAVLALAASDRGQAV